VRKRLFCANFVLKPINYRDRLGTDIEKKLRNTALCAGTLTLSVSIDGGEPTLRTGYDSLIYAIGRSPAVEGLGAKKQTPSICAIFLSICQDRLGTNIRKR
jgi:hypothetical protein